MRLRIINQELLIFYEKMGKIAVLSSFFIFISIMPFAAYAKVNQLTIPTGVGSSDDSSCLVIKRVELMNIDAFPNAGRLIQWAKQAQGNCLDEKGLSSLRDTLQWQLVTDGYITSHAVFTEDSYVDGTLFLTLIPGRLASIEHHEDSQSYAQLKTVFPGRQGDLVNLRNLEQGLDNLQRLPSVNATMDVVLNPEDLSSQIMVTRQQSRFWRMNAFLDDAGHYGVGRYRAGATIFLDNPLSLSDLVYFSASRELDNHHDKGSHNFALHYSIPFGYWLLSMAASQGAYYQSLLVANTAYKYHTYWRSLDMQIQWLLMRGYNYKTVGYTGALIRKSNRFFADIELEIQRSDTVDWQLGLQHLHYTRWATISGGVNYQQGTQWFGARPSPGRDSFSTARLINLTASLNIPFTLDEQHFQYQPTFSQQYTRSAVTMQDKFSIGGRNSVRGFTTGNALVGPQGWFLKNDIAWINQRLANQLYLGLDYGEVSDKGGQFLLGDRLVGAVIGVRGYYRRLGYDFNISTPLDKPAHFNTDPVVLGFMLNWQY
ncbi:TPA: ShlB/FhaC/HecB family hemolysin secretion/activation protein [Yersinia enterocolitica]|uniref:ShlB/FhaC/HecB family hemolysin secretion/activation protein n=1 Tax=Yersinia enterocolitica TaxID=630 RepID=UPI0029A53DF8|nr:ShlB/FhaC/HecB family hemolysin secretion/activation protein [Yersinia enterocolitica]EMA9427241.1 ShlB/FhaC/HecB family hemolysin secretion/activation protein [Yersinia enterocolitica]HDL7805502.1 ShlB/FhaC/HecB family hemolysin secretion/activation protein [Yersinia enterocolitica]HEI6712705.1 ShlB/FhaC/HecB family hemolysin secretion/activation protein [Yersinia enterocolitica]HEI6907194.1 ShlB/FhaC/HecB family hemolysin secretion/activation protein [Yersinia enterocolitica]